MVILFGEKNITDANGNNLPISEISPNGNKVVFLPENRIGTPIHRQRTDVPRILLEPLLRYDSDLHGSRLFFGMVVLFSTSAASSSADKSPFSWMNSIFISSKVTSSSAEIEPLEGKVRITFSKREQYSAGNIFLSGFRLTPY